MKMFASLLVLMLSLMVTPHAFATASSVSQTVYHKVLEHGRPVKVYKLVVTANSADGSVTDVTVAGVHGYLMKAITKPGTTQPTSLYDIALNDPDGGLDALNGALGNRSASAAEQVFPTGPTNYPLYLPPADYTLHITNNSVNSAQVTIWLYFVDDNGSRIM